MTRTSIEPYVRVLSRTVFEPGGCWRYQGFLVSGGYGQVALKTGKKAMAHRVVFEAQRGKIPEGMTLDHLCRVRNCVRPDHLDPCSVRTNVLRGETSAAAYAARTRCARGHPLEGQNLILRKNHNRGQVRECRECKNEQQRKARAKRRAHDD